jgi:phospholipase C
MMLDLTAVDTIVMVLMENRSFDHMLGHLSYGEYAIGTPVEGLRDPLTQQAYENIYEGIPYYPFVMQDGPLSGDLPHDRPSVETQLAYSSVTGTYSMSGFVEAYYQSTTTNRTQTPDPMGFFPPSAVPTINFFANNFAICDHWFAPLPTSTQPNRLMALTGASLVDDTRDHLLPASPTLLDWATSHGVRWRVYHAGLSFFILLGRFDEVLGPNFRAFEHLARDVGHEASDTFPQLILIEPLYADAPHLGSDQPNDDHPPLAVGFGEQFLRQIYEALTCNPERWAKTVLIVTYDEHGGFFDHMPPLSVPYAPPDAAYPPFATTGVRVPALVVSPLVAARHVYSGPLDHTSVLQFLAERFSPDEGGYSTDVDQRRAQGITSVSEVLNLSTPRPVIPAAPREQIQSVALLGPGPPEKTPSQRAFENAALAMIRSYPHETAQKHPELWHWYLTTQH